MPVCNCSVCLCRKFDQKLKYSKYRDLELSSELLELGGPVKKYCLIPRIIAEKILEVSGSIRPEVSSKITEFTRRLIQASVSTPGRRSVNRDIERIFGIKVEGLSPEDVELTAARQIVRFVRTAAHFAAHLPIRMPASEVARRSVIAAARQWAPGLLAGRPRPNSGGAGDRGTRVPMAAAKTPSGKGRTSRFGSSSYQEETFNAQYR